MLHTYMRKLLIYTLTEGGEFHVLADFVDEQGYLEIKERGWFDVRFGEGMTHIQPAYIAFAITTDDHDFVLQSLNRNR